MKKLPIILSLLFVLASCNKLEPDDIIMKNIVASGFTSNDNVFNSVQMFMKTSGMGMENDTRLFVDLPGKFRIEITNGGKTFVMIVNDNEAWTYELLSNEITELTEKDLIDIVAFIDTQFPFPFRLYNYKEFGAKVKYLGKLQIEIPLNIKGESSIAKKDVHKLKLTTDNGSKEEYYFDAQSYLLLRKDIETQFNEQRITISQFYTDYRKTDGKILSHEQILTVEGQELSKISFESISFDKQIPADLFQKNNNQETK